MLTTETMMDLDVVVSCFYDASLGKVTWDVPLGMSADCLGTPNAVFSVRDPVTRKAHFSFGNFGANPEFIESFAKTYAPLSPFVIATALAPEGRVVNPIEMIGRAEYERGRFHREWSAPQNYHDYMGAVLLRRPDAIYTIAFGRTADRPLFSSVDMEILQFLVPHVTRALKISERLNTFEREKAELLSTLDSLATPIFLVDRDAKIHQCNTAGLSLVALGHGVSNTNGTLRFEDEAVAREFKDLRDIAIGHPVVMQSKLKGVLQVQLLARNVAGGANSDRIMVVIDRSVASTPPLAGDIATKFGITVAELRVLLQLVDNQNIKDIAFNLGLSLNTIKTHIAHLFQKTKTNNQRALLKAVSDHMPKVLVAAPDR